MYLPNILGLLTMARCACPFSELRFWCPLVAGSCPRWKTAVSWRPPQLCQNTTASLCAARWARSGDNTILFCCYYYYSYFGFLSHRRLTTTIKPNRTTYRSTMWVIEQIRHDHVGEPVIAVGQQKYLGTTLPDPGQEHGQPRVFVDIIG